MKKEIEKYINNELTDTQSLEVLKAIQNNKDDLDYYISLKTEQTLLKLSQEDMKSNVLDAYKKFNQKYMLKRKRRSRFIFSASAALILILIGIYFVNNPQKNDVTEIVAIDNEHYKNIVLSDGSTVILRENSTLSFNDFSNASFRTVHIEGEAFFDVVKNDQKPFVVSSNGLEIKVLGTKFNVRAIPDSAAIETILFTGQVNLIKNKMVISSLAPNQKATYNIKSNELVVTDLESTQQLLENKQGLLVFENTRLDEMLSKLEERYNKTSVIRVDDIEKYHYTGKFNTSQSIAEVITILNSTSPIKYSMENNVIVLENK